MSWPSKSKAETESESALFLVVGSKQMLLVKWLAVCKTGFGFLSVVPHL